MHLRPLCGWICRRPARYRDLHHEVNYCGTNYCRRMLEFEYSFGKFRRRDQVAPKFHWHRITPPRLVQWWIFSALKLLGDLCWQISFNLARGVAGRFWRQNQISDWDGRWDSSATSASLMTGPRKEVRRG